MTLRASSSPAELHVRASIDDGVSVEKIVRVDGNPPVATLVVSGSYVGERSAPSWTVAPFPGVRCQDLSPQTADPSDAMSATTLPISVAVTIDDSVAVVVHSDQRIRGCTDVVALTAGETRLVNVSLSNTPADARAFPLLTTFNVGTVPSTWGQLVSEWKNRYILAALSSASDDGGLILDAIASQLSASQLPEFESSRAQLGWDAFLSGFYVLSSPSATLDMWASSAASELKSTSTGLFGRLRFDSTSPGQCTLDASQIFAQPIASSTVMSWSIDDGDRVFLGGNLSVSATQVLGSLVEALAMSSTDQPTAVDALDTVVQCKTISDAMEQPSGEVFAGCDHLCFASLCRSGLSALIARARSTDDDPSRWVVLKVSASGASSLDAQARLVGFDGSWVGGVADPGAITQEVSIGGGVTALKLP
ncbi:MAG: hypothetical protein U0165_15430 [Polyangiaceae bacterium]